MRYPFNCPRQVREQRESRSNCPGLFVFDAPWSLDSITLLMDFNLRSVFEKPLQALGLFLFVI